jgi:hypothetical protein
MWNRRASNLGDRTREQYILEQLRRRWPEAEYPIHIDIIGQADSTAVGVQIRNGDDINIFEKAHPEQYLGEEPSAQVNAVLAKAEQILQRLRAEKKL